MKGGPVTIIGIDMSCNPAKTGLALGQYEQGRVKVKEVCCGSKEPESPSSIVQKWISRANGTRVLLAIDAPLGWPAPMGEALKAHVAGDPISQDSNALFRRQTDKFVYDTLKKQPLDVGANLIARTAVAALGLLNSFDTPPSIVLGKSNTDGLAVIEVYPAATMIAWGIEHKDYKGKNGEEMRNGILRKLQKLEIDVNGVTIKDITKTDHVLDAVICLLAAKDFLDGNVHLPENKALAEIEGWIWFRDR